MFFPSVNFPKAPGSASVGKQIMTSTDLGFDPAGLLLERRKPHTGKFVSAGNGLHIASLSNTCHKKHTQTHRHKTQFL